MALALPCESAIAAANLGRVNAAFFAEPQRRMLRIFFKQREIFIGQFLNVLGEPPYSTSRRRAARVTSRKRREIARVDLLERFLVLAAWGEVLFDLFVPSKFVATRNMRSKLRQIFRRQLINGLFDFRKTHNRSLAAADSISILFVL
jgi:hypothetical protein